MSINFNEKTHRYWFQSSKTDEAGVRKPVKVYVPSVTTILQVIDKPALQPWAVRTTVNFLRDNIDSLADVDGMSIFTEAKNAHKVASSEAADIGTQVHTAIENFLNQKNVDIASMGEQARSAYSAFLDWSQENNIKIEQTEVRLHNKDEGYAGTCDAIGTVGDDSVLLDWKTGKGIFPEARLQVAAYAVACGAALKKFISRAYIVRFGKNNSGFEVVEVGYEEISEAYQTFLAAKKIYEWQRGNK